MVLQKNFTKSRNDRLMSFAFCAPRTLADLNNCDRVIGIDSSQKVVVRIS
jgi:hypothetical protein